MLYKAFRTKEGKIITAILGVIIIIACGIVVINNIKIDRQAKQAVMAENYLKAGNYEQAVEAYQQAMSIANSDKELLMIGLSDAYVGMQDFDKALEILRSYYQKTSAVKIKDKIEEVTSAKTDYEFLQSISRGDRYFANKEYDKAITEYEKAKLIKSKDPASYEKIAQAYIAKGDYTLAKKKVLEGQEILKNQELDETMALVDSFVYKAQYDEIIEQAEEYVYQENYENSIQKYNEAMALLPREAEAYLGLAKVYILQEEYDQAILILSNETLLIENKEIKELFDQATHLKEVEDQRNSILSELIGAMKNLDMNKVKAVLGLAFFKENIVGDIPIFYGSSEGDISRGYGLIIIDKNNIYYGDIKNGIKNGLGTYFTLVNEAEGNYLYYNGEWNNDLPSGVGKTVEAVVLLDELGEKIEEQTVTEGIFYNGYENDTMKKRFYRNGEETGSVLYSAQEGVPQSITEETTQEGEEGSYPIGKLIIKGEQTEQYYFAEPNTVWGFAPYIKRVK